MHKNISYVSLERMVLVVTKFATLIIISGQLGTEGQGIYSLLISTWTTGAIFGLLGFEVSNNYYGAKNESPKYVSVLLGNTIVFSLFAIIVSVFLWTIIYRSTDLFSNVNLDILFVLLFGLALTIAANGIGRLVFGLSKFKDHLIGVAIHQGFFLILVVVFFITNALTIHIAAWLWVLGLALRVIYWYWVVMISSQWRANLDFSVFRDQFGYGIVAFPYHALNAINFRINNFIIIYLLDATSLGIYSIALAASEVILYLPRTFTNLVLTEVSKKGELSLSVFRMLMGSLLIAVILVGAVAPFAIPILLPDTFRFSVFILVIMLPGIIFLGMSVIGVHYLFGLRQRSVPSVASFVSLVVIVVTDFVLIPVIGIAGAAVASVLAYFAMSIVVYAKVSQMSEERIYRFFTPSFDFVKNQLSKFRKPSS